MAAQSSASVIQFQPPLRVAFGKLGFTAGQQKKLMRWSVLSVAAFSLAQIQRAFTSTQAQPGGKAWHGLSQSWAERKTKLGKSAKIGTFKGYLSGSFAGSTNPRMVKSAKAVEVKDMGHRVDVGTKIPYGGHFNSGTKFMKARPFIPVDTFVTDYWKKLHLQLLEKPESVPNA